MKKRPRKLIQQEWPLFASVGSAAILLYMGASWSAAASNSVWFAVLLAWLFAVILLSAFAVVRHAERLAAVLGEPFGTLILTLAVTGIEVLMISAVMLTGGQNETLARDAMFAVVMIVLNGMVGLSLLLGGLRYHEQTYNLLGANSFLAVIIPLAVLGLILPDFTETTPGPTLSPKQSAFLVFMSVGLYGVFLAIQNVRHREYFTDPAYRGSKAKGTVFPAVSQEGPSVWYHAAMLLAYLIPLFTLSKRIAVPIDYAIHGLHAPAALGGFLVAVLILAPESLAAIRAALANELQRAVNILLGSVLATISLTIPAVLVIGYITQQMIVLGLNGANGTLLILTLAVSMLTFASERTNVLLGAVHVLLFLAYLMLIFER